MSAEVTQLRPRMPADFEAEECVLGACLLSGDAVAWAAENLLPSDFYRPSHMAVFAAILALYREGSRSDYVTVQAKLRQQGFDAVSQADLVSLQANAPAISGVKSYGAVVQRHSASRAALLVLEQGREALADGTGEPADVVDDVRQRLAEIDSPLLVADPGDLSGREFLSVETETFTPWVIPGMLRQDWRCMMVGVEGHGRSVLLRQLGVAAAYGIHPFVTTTRFAPQRTLVIDLENPLGVVQDSTRRIAQTCQRITGESHDDNWRVWHRDDGIDLRKRAYRAELEDILRRHQPSIVVIGPLYKSFYRSGSESYEEPALRVQQVFDDLRKRHRFALVIEHHAPHAPSGGQRVLRPEGSSLWLRWGELRWQLIPVENQPPYDRAWQDLPGSDRPRAVRRKGFSGDRVTHAWPDAFAWGSSSELPWVGWWKDGHDQEERGRP